MITEMVFMTTITEMVFMTTRIWLVQDAIRRGDLDSPAKYARIYELRPVVHQ